MPRCWLRAKTILIVAVEMRRGRSGRLRKKRRFLREFEEAQTVLILIAFMNVDDDKGEL